MIAKGALGEGATGWAQGGIAAVLEEGDSFEAHVSDTMVAGAGLNDAQVVEHVVGAGAGRDRAGWSSSACRSRPKATRCT